MPSGVDQLEVELENAEIVINALMDGVVSGFENTNYATALSEFSDVLEERHQGYFDRRESPTAEPWKEWFWRDPDAEDSHETLEVSGTLRGSLRRGGLGHIEEVTRSSLLWGTGIRYAALHNFGGQVRTGVPLVSRGGRFYLPAGSLLNIPQREFVGMNDELTDDLAGYVADWSVLSLMPRAAQP